MAVFNNILAGASGQAGGAAAGIEIERSLRFNSADSAYLSRIPASAGNRTTWTWAGWIKRSSSSGTQAFFGTGAGSVEAFDFSGSALRLYLGGGAESLIQTINVFRDYSAWYHIILAVDTNQTTPADKTKIYVNGVLQTNFATTSPQYPSDAYETFLNNNNEIFIGARGTGGSQPFHGYLADIHFIDGQQLDHTDLGFFDNNGVWQPKEYTGTYGTNGFHLDFADNSSTTSGSNVGIGKDVSGNGNYFNSTNISVSAGRGNDSLFDSPTNGDPSVDTGLGGELSGNYCTLNPLDSPNNIQGALTNGNLELAGDPANYAMHRGTVAIPTTGKWYYECQFNGTAYTPLNYTTQYSGVGMCKTNVAISGVTDGNTFWIGDNGYGCNFSGLRPNYAGQAIDSGDIVGVAIDRDANTFEFFLNGTSTQTGTIGVASGAALSPYAFCYSNTQTTLIINFGQRPFAHQAPSGYKSLCTANLPTPDIEDGSTAMDVVQYPGDGVSETVTGLEFGPDLVWIKVKDSVRSHFWFDTVREAENYILSDPDVGGVEVNDPTTLTSFTSDGFSVGSSADVNRNTSTIVAWTWDAGGAPTTDNVAGAGNVPTAGSVKIDGANSTATLAGSIAATRLSANTSTGFSIVKFTMGSGAQTVAHGLGQEPALVITKILDSTGNWFVFMDSTLGTNKHLYLNKPDIPPTVARTASSSSTLAVDNSFHADGNKYIKYCWAPVDGYSAFGSYTGNGLTDGPFVYTGFRPRWVLIKKSSDSTDALWLLYDTARDTYNVSQKYLIPSGSNIEGSALYIDVLSNGFKLRQASNQAINYSGATYVYACFAESPFKIARAR